MKRRQLFVLVACLLVLLAGGTWFNSKARLLWRRHGVYPLDGRLALASGGLNVFLIDRVHGATYRVSPYGRLVGPVGYWPRGDVKGVALDDRVKIEDDRYGYRFDDGSVIVSFPGVSTTTATIRFRTDW